VRLLPDLGPRMLAPSPERVSRGHIPMPGRWLRQSRRRLHHHIGVFALHRPQKRVAVHEVTGEARNTVILQIASRAAAAQSDHLVSGRAQSLTHVSSIGATRACYQHPHDTTW